MQGPRRELHLFFATENSRAVVLYRAKNGLFRLITWETKEDSFEPGQWLKSTIDVSKCALSPDGRHFSFFALSKDAKDWYQAISKPPFFTAVELFSGLTPIGCGAHFLNRDTISLRSASSKTARAKLPCGLMLELRPSETPLVCAHSKGQIADAFERYHSDGAKLYRKTASGNTLIKDFGNMQFESIKAPYEGVQRRNP